MALNRNVESRFALAPSASIGRSKFDRPQDIKFTGNAGVLIPFYCDEVLPGDTHQIKTNKVIRMQTPATPFMDNVYCDVMYFFVPNRLVWTHWKELNGENNASPWLPTASYQVPFIVPSSNNYVVQMDSAPDYLGIPTGVPIGFNALPLRAYYLIWNEFFRDENLQYPVNFSTGDSDVNINNSNGTPHAGDSAYSGNGRPMMVSKYHDYFTSVLPAPQKGPDVALPITGNIPVKSLDSNGNVEPFQFTNSAGTSISTNYNPVLVPRNAPSDVGRIGYSGLTPVSYVELDGVKSNLFADLGSISVATINQLRTAFQLQKLYEKDARGGTRYIEVIKSHFGVTNPDYRLQRPQYLGGSRIPINVNQVIQSSESQTTPQGTATAYSLTVDSHGDFIQSFTEHGYIIGVCCFRYDHTYQQGLERMWSRRTRFDFYWPVFANLGEQAVKVKEIYATGTSADDQVFGYQEAWADYRYKPNRVAGQMRSNATGSLDMWHLADDYASQPMLSAGWIVEDPTNLDRVLTVAHTVSDQFFADFYVQNRTTRPMPMYSIPGLIDHH